MKSSIFHISILVLVLLISGCKTPPPMQSEAQCRPARIITTDISRPDVPLLAIDRRWTVHAEQSLLSNFNARAEDNAVLYCLQWPTPCAHDFRAGTASEINKRNNFGYTVPNWRTLPPSPRGSYRAPVRAVEPTVENVGCKNEVEIEIPPPLPPEDTGGGHSGGDNGGTVIEEEHVCNPLDPAWMKTSGWTGAIKTMSVRGGQTIMGRETALFTREVAATKAAWLAEINAACLQANPGGNCTGDFDPEPDFTYIRLAPARDPNTRLLLVRIKLKLRNTVNGICVD
jgi:hypothetical protein